MLADLGHGAGDEEAVDPGRGFQGLAQTAGRLEVEGQGDGAELQIQVQEHGLLLALLAEDPGQADRHGAGADTAARTDDGDPLGLLGFALGDLLNRLAGLLGPRDRGRQGLLGHRLDQVVGHAGADQLAVEADVVDRADADQLGLVGEGRGQRQHRRQRRVGLPEIDDHDPRRRHHLHQILQGLLGAAIEHERRGEHVTEHARDHIVRLTIVDKCNAVSVYAACRLWQAGLFSETHRSLVLSSSSFLTLSVR